MQEMTWQEVEDAVGRDLPILLPVGSTEQHGMHLPLGTDAFLPLAVLERVSQRLEVVIAPPILYGYRSRVKSGGGQSFVGTTSLSAGSFIGMVADVLAEFLRHGFRRIAVVNWHLENAGLLYESADIAMKAPHRDGARIMLVEDVFPQFGPEEMAFLFPEGFPGWDVEHASIIETSLMLVVHPEMVRRDRIVDGVAAERPPYDMLPTPPGMLSRSGALWKPSQASEEKGRLLLSRLVDHLYGLLAGGFGLQR